MTYPHNENDGRGRGYPDDNRRGAPPNGRDDRGSAPPSNQRGGGPGPDDDDDGELMDEGEWPIQAVSHKFGFASTNNEQVGVRVRFTDGPYKGKLTTWYGSFSDAAVDITIRALRALGMVGDDVSDLSGIYKNPGNAIGVVKHDRYQGKVRARVAFINGADVVMKAEMNPQQLKGFAQRMRGAFARAAGGGAGGNSSSGGGNRQAGGGRDDGRGQQGNFEDQRRGGGGRDDRAAPPPDDSDTPWNTRERGGR